MTEYVFRYFTLQTGIHMFVCLEDRTASIEDEAHDFAPDLERLSTSRSRQKPNYIYSTPSNPIATASGVSRRNLTS